MLATEVKVDTETGFTKVTRMAMVHDRGQPLNEMQGDDTDLYQERL